MAQKLDTFYTVFGFRLNEREFRKVETRLQRVQKVTQGVAKWGGRAAISSAIGLGGYALTAMRTASKMQDAVSQFNIAVRKGGEEIEATRARAKKLRPEIEKIFLTTGTDWEELWAGAEAAFSVGGFNTKQRLDLIREAATGAAVGWGEVRDLISASTTGVGLLRAQGNEVTEIGFFNAVKAGATQADIAISTFFAGYRNAMTPSLAAGTSLAQSLAEFAIAASTFGSGEAARAPLERAHAQLLGQRENVKQLLGIDVAKSLRESGLSEIIAAMNERGFTKYSDWAERLGLSQEAAQSLQTLQAAFDQQNIPEMVENIARSMKGGSLAAQDFAVISGDASVQLSLLGAQFKLLQEKVGVKLLPFLASAADAMSKFFDYLEHGSADISKLDSRAESLYNSLRMIGEIIKHVAKYMGIMGEDESLLDLFDRLLRLVPTLIWQFLQFKAMGWGMKGFGALSKFSMNRAQKKALASGMMPGVAMAAGGSALTGMGLQAGSMVAAQKAGAISAKSQTQVSKHTKAIANSTNKMYKWGAGLALAASIDNAELSRRRGVLPAAKKGLGKASIVAGKSAMGVGRVATGIGAKMAGRSLLSLAGPVGMIATAGWMIWDLISLFRGVRKDVDAQRNPFEIALPDLPDELPVNAPESIPLSDPEGIVKALEEGVSAEEILAGQSTEFLQGIRDRSADARRRRWELFESERNLPVEERTMEARSARRLNQVILELLLADESERRPLLANEKIKELFDERSFSVAAEYLSDKMPMADASSVYSPNRKLDVSVPTNVEVNIDLSNRTNISPEDLPKFLVPALQEGIEKGVRDGINRAADNTTGDTARPDF